MSTKKLLEILGDYQRGDGMFRTTTGPLLIDVYAQEAMTALLHKCPHTAPSDDQLKGIANMAYRLAYEMLVERASYVENKV